MTRWYAVHTQLNAEAKASWHLRNQGFTVYLPRRLKRRSHARRVELVATPLFPRYLFIALDLAAMRWRAIRSTVGVADLVRNGETPAAVPLGIVEEIMAREDEHGIIPLPAAPKPARGERVEIFDSALSGITGIFESATDQERVVVLLDLLGRQVRATLPIAAIKAA
jgi:transcriptional antiterminator RfaH